MASSCVIWMGGHVTKHKNSVEKNLCGLFCEILQITTRPQLMFAHLESKWPPLGDKVEAKCVGSKTFLIYSNMVVLRGQSDLLIKGHFAFALPDARSAVFQALTFGNPLASPRLPRISNSTFSANSAISSVRKLELSGFSLNVYADSRACVKNADPGRYLWVSVSGHRRQKGKLRATGWTSWCPVMSLIVGSKCKYKRRNFTQTTRACSSLEPHGFNGHSDISRSTHKAALVG